MISSDLVGEEYMAAQADEDADLLKALRRDYSYDPKTGEFVYALGQKSRTRRNAKGYGSLEVDGQVKSTAQLVWLLHHGFTMPSWLRHANGNLRDDRIENIAVLMPGRGVEGCHRKWVARAPAPRKGVQKVLGVFKSYEEALKAHEDYVAGADLV